MTSWTAMSVRARRPRQRTGFRARSQSEHRRHGVGDQPHARRACAIHGPTVTTPGPSSMSSRQVICSPAIPSTDTSGTFHQVPYQKAPSPYTSPSSLAASTPIFQTSSASSGVGAAAWASIVDDPDLFASTACHARRRASIWRLMRTSVPGPSLEHVLKSPHEAPVRRNRTLPFQHQRYDGQQVRCFVARHPRQKPSG
ncbi:MAG: hypothetical protein SGPRY_002779 [Prymnesium sp.]